MTVRHFYVNRKTRSNSEPIETGYVYSQTGDSPGSLTTFGSTSANDYHMDREISNSDNDFERMKSLSNYELSRNMDKTNAMFDASAKMNNYMSDQNFNMDDEDIRTDSGNLYDTWPYYYSYFEPMLDMHTETIKDKRYIEPSHDIKPVHEYVDEEMPNDMSFIHTERYMRNVQYTTPFPYTVIHQPISDNNGFLSYDINDNYDKNKYNDEDSFTFKGLDNYYSVPITHHANHHNYDIGNKNKHAINQDIGKFVTEKAYEKKHDFDKHEKGNNEKEHHKGEYEKGGKKYNEYKNFKDAFGNRYSTGNENKDSKYELQNNSHKGEKKKGFHRVYHKNEYQEDNEFFDNNEKKANAEEKGGIHHNSGHQNGILHSQAAVSLGNEGMGFKNVGGFDKDKFEHNHSGDNAAKGIDKNLHAHVNFDQNSAQYRHGDYANRLHI